MKSEDLTPLFCYDPFILLEKAKPPKETDYFEIGFEENGEPFVNLRGKGSNGVTLGATSLVSTKTGVVTQKPAGSITIFDSVGKVLWDVP